MKDKIVDMAYEVASVLVSSIIIIDNFHLAFRLRAFRGTNGHNPFPRRLACHSHTQSPNTVTLLSAQPT